MFTRTMFLEVRELYERYKDIETIAHNLKIDPIVVQNIVDLLKNLS